MKEILKLIDKEWLLKSRSFVLSIIILLIINGIFLNCSDKKTVSGNWGAIDSDGDYAEFYFSSGKMKIYHEIAGALSAQNYAVKNDSLLTNVFHYKIEKVNPDSLVLTADSVTMYLKRITTGNKLSDFNDDKNREIYTTAFYNRMKLRKGKIPENYIDSIPQIEEEIIEINSSDKK